MYRYIISLVMLTSMLFGVSTVYANENLTPLEQIIRKSRPRLDKVVITAVADAIYHYSAIHNLNPNLVAAVIWAESRFKPSATGKKGEIGLMQIRYGVWKESSILKDNGVSAKDKLYWIDKNVACGTKILTKYLEYAKGDIVKALYRYNTGKPQLPAGLERHQFRYVNTVLIRMYEITEHIRLNQ